MKGRAPAQHRALPPAAADFIKISPGDCYCYGPFHLPPDHPDGTFWVSRLPEGGSASIARMPAQGRRAKPHAAALPCLQYHIHHHGSAALQSWSGMAGLFIVSGKTDEVLESYSKKQMQASVRWVACWSWLLDSRESGS